MNTKFYLYPSLLACALALAGVAVCQGIQTHIKTSTAVGEVFGAGEKITTAILEYDQEINNAKLSASAFAVKDRTITKVYANRSAQKTAQGVNGRFVVIELGLDDKEASVLTGGPGSGNGPRPGGPGGQAAPAGPGGPGNAAAAGMPSGPPPTMEPAKRKPIKLSVAQVGEVATAKGVKIAADPNFFETVKAVNLIVDDFKQLTFKDPVSGDTLMYNLFVPKNYDKTKSYPMVLFMHDASVDSPQHDRTLIQGLGAVVWASPEDQARHPAFVLAPQNNSAKGATTSQATDSLETFVHLVQAVANEYNIDKNRIYTTGQSAGCMRSLTLNIHYPDLFAASLLVAGQWDPQETSVLIGKKMWIVVSEGDQRAFPGMNASVAAWEKNGAKITRGRWSARAPQPDQAAQVARMIAEGNNIRYTLFEKGTTLPAGQENSGGQEHMSSWQFAYAIPALRDWLFTQSKTAKK